MRHLDCRRFLATLVVLLTFHFALAAPVGAQELGAQERGARNYEELIERLELGISALDELGRVDARNHLKRIADEVREEREKERTARRQHARGGENGEIREVRRRLAVMRYAVDVLVDVERIDMAELVERAMHTRELAIAGERGAEAQRIREAAPNRAQLSEVLGVASRLHAERGRHERAQALKDLSKLYRDQWNRRQKSGRGETERRGGRERQRDLSNLGTRVDILRLAREAHAEAKNKRLARLLESAVEIGELQLEGAEGDALAAAIEMAGPGLSMGNVIESLQAGAGLHDDWGNARKAAAVRALAEYYAKRERGRGADRPATSSEAQHRQEDSADLRRLTERLARLEAELAKLRAELRALDRR